VDLVTISFDPSVNLENHWIDSVQTLVQATRRHNPDLPIVAVAVHYDAWGHEILLGDIADQLECHTGVRDVIAISPGHEGKIRKAQHDLAQMADQSWRRRHLPKPRAPGLWTWIGQKLWGSK
jgi:hypothetical protein